jgi:hypothetical protein
LDSVPAAQCIVTQL